MLAGVASTCGLEPFTTRLLLARTWLTTGVTPDSAEVRKHLGNGISACESCVTAVYLSLRFLDRPLLELIDFIATLGGDADTIGAMAGAIWGAANGVAALPAAGLAQLEERDRINALAIALHTLCINESSTSFRLAASQFGAEFDGALDERVDNCGQFLAGQVRASKLAPLENHRMFVGGELKRRPVRVEHIAVQQRVRECACWLEGQVANGNDDQQLVTIAVQKHIGFAQEQVMTVV